MSCKDDDFISTQTELIIPPPIELDLDPILVEEGKEIFHLDTFGDEAFWSNIYR